MTAMHTTAIPTNVRAFVRSCKQFSEQNGTLSDMYLVEAGGTYRWLRDDSIVGAANQTDTGDGLVQFYSALLEVCREFARREAVRREWGLADEVDYETGELPARAYGVTNANTPFYARVVG